MKTSIYFNRDISDEKTTETHTHNRNSNAFFHILDHFKTSYRNRPVILWSVFYSVALCFYIQITAFIQVLYISIDDSQEIIYNGAVDGVLTTFSVAVSLLAGKIHLSFLISQNRIIVVLMVMSSLQGVFVVLAAKSQTLLMCYIFYIIYATLYAFCITICASEIAKKLKDDAFGLVFGFNTFVALIIQTLVTVSVVSSGFKLPPSLQYQVYGCFYLALGVLYFCYFLLRIIK